MEFNPLYSAGLHKVTETDLFNIFVSSLGNTKQRIDLTNKFLEFIKFYKQFKIDAEIYIDGSYVTQKPNPNDIDVVLFFKAVQVNALSDAQKKVFSQLMDKNTVKTKYGIHLFLVETNDAATKNYWLDWFGHDRNKNPKGIATLNI